MEDDSTPPPSEPTAPAPPPPTTTGSPTDFLKGVVGKRVVVRLTSGVDYKGECLVIVMLLRAKQSCRTLVNRCVIVSGWLYEYCA